MSAQEFKPGDLAMVTMKGEEVMCTRYATGFESGWFHGVGLVDKQWGHPDSGTTPRPLVVIDPEDREQVERLADLLIVERATTDGVVHSGVQAALRSLITPPKPEEPTGLGAVVEDVEGSKWIRWCSPGAAHSFSQQPWQMADGGGADTYWSDITAVRVLSEGVTP